MTSTKLPGKTSVVIIGAGLSGLVAARELVKSGSDVVVVEAQDELGGRLKSFTRENGQVLQRGGEVTGPAQSELGALAAEYGIGTEHVTFVANLEAGKQMLTMVEGERIIEPYPMAGDEEAGAAYAAAVAAFDELCTDVPPDAPWTAPRAAELDHQSVGAWLDANVPHPAARAGLAGAFGAFGGLYEVSLLYVVTFIAAYGGVENAGGLHDHFVGGTAQIPQKLAEELGDRVVLSAPVRKLEHTETGVVAHTDRGSIEGEAVIFAMTPGQCAKIEFEPALPAGRDRLQSRWLAGHGAKYYVMYDRPFWLDEDLAGLAMGLPFVDVWMDVSPADGSEGVLMGFQFSSSAAEVVRSEITADEERTRETVLADLEAYFGPQAASPKEYHRFMWSGSRWSDGCGGQVPLGVLSTVGPALREPVGRIFWAGAETEAIDYMEGAVRSGKRAAAEASAAIS